MIFLGPSTRERSAGVCGGRGCLRPSQESVRWASGWGGNDLPENLRPCVGTRGDDRCHCLLMWDRATGRVSGRTSRRFLALCFPPLAHPPSNPTFRPSPSGAAGLSSRGLRIGHMGGMTVKQVPFRKCSNPH